MIKTYLKSLVHQPFTYSPLSSDRSIRIVAIQNVSVIPDGTERMELSIEERSLDAPGEYWALSYVCGDARPVADIRLNGRFFGIGGNLHLALQYAWLHFFHSDGGALWENPGSIVAEQSPSKLCLWIDAICICQSDVAEKSRQIRLMKEIFENAQRVLCWLGGEGEDFRAGYPKLRQITAWYDEVNRRLGGIGVNKYIIDNVAESGLFTDTNGEMDLEAWEALGKFFKRPYWRRIWTVQECTTQAITTYLCGTTAIASRTFEIANVVFLGCLAGSGFERLEKITGIEEILRRVTFKRLRKESPQDLTLLKVANMIRGFEATDPRDMVYACVAVAADGAQLHIDYGLSVIDVYLEYASFEFGKGTLDILGFVGKSVDPPPGLPSWIPDWKTYVRRSPFPKLIEDVNHAETQPVYYADCFCRSDAQSWKIDISSRQLLLRGVFVDRIQKLGEYGSQSLFDVSAEYSWASLCSHAVYVPTGEVWLAAFFRVLVADVCERDGKAISRASNTSWPNHLGTEADLLEITKMTSVSGSRRMSCMKSRSTMRRFALTHSGYIGLVPSYAEIGDEIWVLAGGQVLYVLRDTGRRDKSSERRIHEFLGEAYIHGLMDGEVGDLGKVVVEVLLE